MVDVYLLLGDRAQGKSATIRALTGIRQWESQWPMTFTNQNNSTDCFIVMRALQETETLPADFVAEVASTRSTTVFCVLRYLAAQNCPDAQGYIDYFQLTAGWRVAGACHLVSNSPSPRYHGHVRPVSVQPRPITTANQRAQSLRQAWGIV